MPTGLLRDLSESSMRLVVGDRSINEVITKRDEIAVEAHRVLQDELDQAETGINVVTVEMKKTNVPTPVQASFNEVNQATQEKEKMIYQAREDYNKAIPAAKGEAERTIKAAEGYSLDRVNRAQGDAARFHGPVQRICQGQGRDQAQAVPGIVEGTASQDQPKVYRGCRPEKHPASFEPWKQWW
jgi:regulator of protease activity HflC (stomatin/prohibitin superfamily)